MPYRTVLARLTMYVVAFAMLPLLVGALRIAPLAPRDPLPGVGAFDAVALPVSNAARPTAVFLIGNQGTEISDLLPPFAAIAASGAFDVVTVAPSRLPSPLLDANIRPTGLAILPDLALDAFDVLFPEPPDLVVVPYIPAFDQEDRALVEWLRDRAGPETVILTICAGTTLAAETGLMQGHRATSHFRFVDGLRARHPGVQWQEGTRYVVDGRFITSGALFAGIDAALAAVNRIAGEEATQRAADAILADAASAAEPRALSPGPRSLRSRLHEAFGVQTGEIGLRIVDGADEMMVAAVTDMLGVSVRATVRTFAADHGPYRTRFGLTLMPELTGVDPAGFSTVFESLPIDQSQTPAFDFVLDWIATAHGTYPAQRAAERFAISTASERPAGPTGDARPLVMSLLLGVAGLLACRIAERAWQRRRAAITTGSARDRRGGNTLARRV